MTDNVFYNTEQDISVHKNMNVITCRNIKNTNMFMAILLIFRAMHKLYHPFYQTLTGWYPFVYLQ